MNQADITSGLRELLKDLNYISESERPFELLEWDAKNDAELRTQIATFTGKPESTLTQTEAAAFFENVQRMADPADAAMMKYAKRYSVLQDFVRNNLTELKVIRAGTVEVHIFITGFVSETHHPIVLHTVAIQT